MDPFTFILGLAFRGKGWGDENNCEMCPSVDTALYKDLCLIAGPVTQVDECGLRPDICGNGKCIDTPDGYKCECRVGYYQRSPMSPCDDLDECKQDAQLCQGGRCINTQG